MKNLFCRLDFWAFVVSMLALLGNLYTYFAHNRRLRKQEAEINELTLRKMKREEDYLNKAQLQISIVKVTKCSSGSIGTIKVQNIGQATAYNVSINEKRGSYYGVSFPNIFGEDIPPTCYIEKRISWAWDSPNELIIQITWQQNDGNHQQDKILKLD